MNAFSVTCVFALIFPFAIGMFFMFKGRERHAFFLGLTCIASALWSLGAFKFSTTGSQEEALLWAKIAHVGIILTPIFFLHFVNQFTKNDRKAILAAGYVLTLFFLGLTFLRKGFIRVEYVFDQFYFFTSNIIDNPLYFLFYLFFYGFVLLVAFVQLIKFHKKTTGIKRNQITYLIFGCIIAWLGPEGMFLLVFGVPLYPYSNIFISIYPFIFGYAILRYRLMDIHLVIKKGMVYSVSAGILASFFVVLVITTTHYVENVTGEMSHTITIFAALIIAVLFNPLKNRVQKIIDKNYYKRTYNYYEVIRNISHNLTTMFEVDTINEFVANTIFDTLGLNSIYVLSAAPDSNCEVLYQRINQHGKKKEIDIARQNMLDYKAEIIRFMIESEDIVINDELPAFEEKIGQDGIERIRREFELFGAEAATSVFIDGTLFLILILGEKMSGDMFTREDISLLKTITDQMRA